MVPFTFQRATLSYLHFLERMVNLRANENKADLPDYSLRDVRMKRMELRGHVCEGSETIGMEILVL